MKRNNMYLADISVPCAAGDAPVARSKPGTVYLVGAGPGNPDLLTVRAHRLITNARVIAHDELVAPEILALAPRNAELFSVGRRAASSMPDRVARNCSVQNACIHAAVIARALAGHD
ncbi:MAG: SAM-dependent methyltransferase, partial [Polyangiaceae bacterium]